MSKINNIFNLFMVCNILVSCENKDRKPPYNEKSDFDKEIFVEDSNLKNNVEPDTLELISKDLELSDVVGDSGIYIWNAAGVQLFFDENKLNICFNPQCNYSYPIKVIDGKTIFFWDNNMNCTFDRGLDKRYSSIRNPHIGDKFGMITKTESGKLKIEYFFKDWVDSVNNNANDVIKLFPDEFDLKYVNK